MAEDIEDPAQEVVSKGARLAITAAAMVAEQIARQRQRTASEIAAAEGAETMRLQSRWDAERAAARAQVNSANASWLERASADEAADAWRTAHVWAQFEPEMFAHHEDRIAAAIEAQYGIDLLADPGVLRGLADSERARERHAELARDGELARELNFDLDDEAGAGIVLSGAAQDAAADRSAIEQGEIVGHGRRADELDAAASDIEYDTDARRAALAQRAASGGADEKTVEGRVVASNANGRPSRLATARRAKAASLGRPPAAPSKSVDIER